MQTKIIQINPADLRLAAVNARYMTHEVFTRLIDNVKRDGRLTSVPFAVRDPDGRYQVLSGNHRVKAALAVNLPEIDVMVTDDELSPAQRTALQLSHNALVGTDDGAILASLYESIDDVNLRLYSGLDDKVLDLLKDADVVGLSEADLEFTTMAFIFLPDEVTRAKEVFERALQSSPAHDRWLARMGDYDRLLDSLSKASTAHGISNMAVALALVLDVFTAHETDLQAGFVDDVGEAKHARPVYFSTIFGDDTIPAQAGAVVLRALNRMISKGEASTGAKWQAIERWAADYLAGP